MLRVMDPRADAARLSPGAMSWCARVLPDFEIRVKMVFISLFL
jgi:hypothetical protein